MAGKERSNAVSTSTVLLAHNMNRHISRVGNGASAAAGASATPTYVSRKVGITMMMGIIMTMTGIVAISGIKWNGGFYINGPNEMENNFGNPNPIKYDGDDNHLKISNDHHHNVPNPNPVVVDRNGAEQELTELTWEREVSQEDKGDHHYFGGGASFFKCPVFLTINVWPDY